MECSMVTYIGIVASLVVTFVFAFNAFVIFGWIKPYIKQYKEELRTDFNMKIKELKIQHSNRITELNKQLEDFKDEVQEKTFFLYTISSIITLTIKPTESKTEEELIYDINHINKIIEEISTNDYPKIKKLIKELEYIISVLESQLAIIRNKKN